MKKMLFKNKKNILLLVLLIILIYYIFHFILAKEIAKSAINLYLENINVNKEEIEFLEIKYDFKIGNQYSINIKYKNEPDLKYEYFYKINDSKLVFFTIFDKENSSIGIKKEVVPIHETLEHIKNIYSDEIKNIEMKYSFFDYIKGYIQKKI